MYDAMRPRRYIASYPGITPVSLSRIRKRIADRVHAPLKLAYKKIDETAPNPFLLSFVNDSCHRAGIILPY